MIHVIITDRIIYEVNLMSRIYKYPIGTSYSSSTIA